MRPETRRRLRRLGAALVLLVAWTALEALWIEPRLVLVRRAVEMPIGGPRLKVVHLSDLHVVRETSLLRRLLARVAAERPDLVAISGDLVRDTRDAGEEARRAAAAAAVVGELRRSAPVFLVQGHSDYPGVVVADLAAAGGEWLSNQGRRIGPGGGTLLLGLNQQVGENARVPGFDLVFSAYPPGVGGGFGKSQPGRHHDFYSHWDPAPAGLADDGGALAWSGYEVTCELAVDRRETGAGIAVLSRYVLGEDRMIRLRRVAGSNGEAGSFALVANGSAFTAGAPDTGVVPEPGRWYRLRVRTASGPGEVRVEARVWPAAAPEPEAWQAWAEDDSPTHVRTGTVGLWAWGGGTVRYRRLKVTGAAGETLLDAPLAGGSRPAGWRDGARATRLELALARSPEVPPGTPRVVLTHVPDVVIEAARLGLDAVLAGHTHGGQVRVPGQQALLTRSALGPGFDRGLFALAAANRRGWIDLYVNPGFGMSFLPIRFACPPSYTVVELGGDG